MKRPALLVTGSAVRIGRGLLLAAAADGHDVAIHYNRSAGPAEDTAAEARALGVRAFTYSHDLRDAAGLDALMEKVLADLPHLGCIVNCASAYTEASIMESDVATYDEQAEVNLRAPFFLTQAFARRAGAGLVVNILDNKIGFNQYPYAAYLLPKTGLERFTKMAALELAPKVRVNAISPGIVMPGATRSSPYIDWRTEAIPVGMTGTVADLYRGLRFFLDSPFVTGQVLTIDGGENTNIVGRNATDFDPEGV
ncbi:MAG: SDR family oxidoreductase [Myxococcota bacterium]|nr:SDR family oxidoreductase [Myxococcota bacterium]